MLQVSKITAAVMIVSQECFESLLGLLSWSWSTFCMLGSELPTVRGSLNQRAAVLDLEQLVYISSASLRLICTYICEVYPVAGKLNATSVLALGIGTLRKRLTVETNFLESQASSMNESY
jgi:hypothetical protein